MKKLILICILTFAIGRMLGGYIFEPDNETTRLEKGVIELGSGFVPLSSYPNESRIVYTWYYKLNEDTHTLDDAIADSRILFSLSKSTKDNFVTLYDDLTYSEFVTKLRQDFNKGLAEDPRRTFFGML